MVDLDGRDVGLRIGQLTGLLAFTLALARSARLFEVGPDQPPWQFILLATALLGAIAWWLLGQLTSSRPLQLAIFGVGAILLVVRITVPETLTSGFLPTAATLPDLGDEFAVAWRVIRSGIPPVEPYLGIIAILAVVMWVIGAMFTWGSTDGPYAALFLPSLVMYFQFAVFDRAQAGLAWFFFSCVALAGSVVSLAMERHTEAGRARDPEGRPLGRRSVALAVFMSALVGVASISVATTASTAVNEYGNAPWRRGDGLGPGPGSGVSYDSLADLRQSVINPSLVPVFTARLAQSTPSGVNPQWRTDTYDTFDGVEWSRSDTSSTQYQPGEDIVAPPNLYRGSTLEILQTVQIQALNSILAPTAGTPVSIQDPGDEVEGNPRLAEEFYSVGGVSIGVSGGLSQLDQYQLRSVVVDREADLGAMATDQSGELSPMFAAAAEDGVFPHQPVLVDPGVAVLPDRQRYLELPENTPAGISNRARAVTAGHRTDFEAAWMLQSWFRDSGAFQYSTDVSTGHDSLILDDWLNDPTSVNHRVGYCEQFAVAMAVLARALEIPSRLVKGFTPGTVDDNGVITVRDNNSHLWVELWIEPYGWYPFDPTPRAEQTGFESQPPSLTAALDPAEYLEAPVDNPTQFPQGPAPDSGLFGELNEELPLGTPTGGTGWWPLAIFGALAALTVIPIAKRIRRRRRLTKVRNGDITAAWDEIVDRLTDLGVEVSPAMTPVEVATHTDRSLLPLALSYSATVYGGRLGQAKESDLVGAEWWIERTYQGSQRTLAAFSLRSLTRRG